MKLILKDVTLMQAREIQTKKGDKFKSVKLNEYDPSTGTGNEIQFLVPITTPGLKSLVRHMQEVEVEATSYVAGYDTKITATQIKVKGGEAK